MNIMTPIALTSAEAALLPRTVSLDLREMRAFVSVARNGNFGRAARELELSQPTVSHQVQRLEDAVGAPLLLRHGRGVTLTPAGATLLDRLDAIAHVLEVPLQQPAATASASGVLRIGVPAELAPVLLPRLVPQLNAAAPQLQLEIHEAPTAQLEEWACSRRIDLAVLQDPPALSGLALEPLADEPLGLVCGVRGAMAHSSRPLKLRELAATPLILPGEQHWIRRKLVQAAFQHGVRLHITLQIESLAALKQMVRNGLGCTVLPQAAVQEEIARGSLAFRPMEQPALGCTHTLAWSEAAEPTVTALARLLRQVVATLVGDGGWAGADALASHPAAAGQAACWAEADSPRLAVAAE